VAVAPDGRRKFGTVRDAIVQVMREAGTELRMRDIHAQVEELLREPVCRGSVKSYLCKGCETKVPLFERVGRGCYRLRRDGEKQ
jgi:hypothetical protein